VVSSRSFFTLAVRPVRARLSADLLLALRRPLRQQLLPQTLGLVHPRCLDFIERNARNRFRSRSSFHRQQPRS